MLIGLKQPTQGEIIYEPGTKIGVVFQTSVLDEMLTVRENLTIRARQYKDLKPNRVSDLIDRLGLSAFQSRNTGRFQVAKSVGLTLRVPCSHNQIFCS